jgi:hypothetical protein
MCLALKLTPMGFLKSINPAYTVGYRAYNNAFTGVMHSLTDTGRLWLQVYLELHELSSRGGGNSRLYGVTIC